MSSRKSVVLTLTRDQATKVCSAVDLINQISFDVLVSGVERRAARRLDWLAAKLGDEIKREAQSDSTDSRR